MENKKFWTSIGVEGLHINQGHMQLISLHDVNQIIL